MPTYEELKALVSFNIPDNQQQLVTPSREREVFNAVINKVEEVEGKIQETGSVPWGQITGTLAAQTDLAQALNDKASDAELAVLAQEIDDLALDVGDLNDLTTVEKGSLVGAANELKNDIAGLQTDNVTLTIYKVSNFGTP